MDAYSQLIEDNDRLRALIARWRSTPQSVAELLPATAVELRATATAKERELYPVVVRRDPGRTKLVDEAVRTNRQVEAFLSAAEHLGPEGSGFLDQAYEAAAAADGQLLHERRDILPALTPEHIPDTELARVVERLHIAHHDDVRRARVAGAGASPASARIEDGSH